MSEKTWYACACGAEHDTPTCPFGYSQPTPDQPPVSAQELRELADYAAQSPDEIGTDSPMYRDMLSSMREAATLIEQQAARIATLEQKRERRDDVIGHCVFCYARIYRKDGMCEDDRGQFHPICGVAQRAEAAEARCTEQAEEIARLKAEREQPFKISWDCGLCGRVVSNLQELLAHDRTC